MADWFDIDLTGSPTSGTPTAAALSPEVYDVAGSMSYTASTVNGQRAVQVGTGFGGIGFDLTAKTAFRVRVIAQWDAAGSLSNHFIFLSLFDSLTAGNLQGDVQVRNAAGNPLHSHWNFASGSPTVVWPKNTPWRIEWGWTRSTGTVCDIWTNPDSTGAPDYTITRTATPDSSLKLNIGATSSVAATMLFSAIKGTDTPGTVIGPYVAPVVVPPTLRGVITGNGTAITPVTLRGVISANGTVITPATLRGVSPAAGLIGNDAEALTGNDGATLTGNE